MGNSKIVYYGETLIDLTGDTVEAAKLLKGVTAHDKKGEKITGTFEAADPYAIIGVTYPEGSGCTCTNGILTLTAKDTSGKALFVIPSAGTWTVKAVKGSKNKSKAVSITAEGQVETVTLTFETILFDNGIIGDVKWDASKVDDATFCTNSVSDVIWLSGTVYDNGLIFAAPSATRGISSAIDLTNYNKVNVRVKQVLSNTGTAKIYVGTSALGDQIATANIALADGQISSLDIPSVTGSKYISIYVRPTGGTYGNKIDVKLDKVWLE
jgi:hypothetical protein